MGDPASYVALSARKRGMDKITELADHLRTLGYVPAVDEDTAATLGERACANHHLQARSLDADPPPVLAIALGGDGAFIHAANLYAARGVPLIGVNLGTVGFLADVPAANMAPELSAVLGGRYRDEQRILLHVTHKRKGEVVASGIVVNDVVIDRGESSHLIWMGVAVDGQTRFELRADGLIFATPGGSTAYSMSAGGPIVTPDLDCIAVTPLNPFSLTHRPLVFSTQHNFAVEIMQHAARLILDGNVLSRMHLGDTAEIVAHDQKLTVRHPYRYDYFKTLREKLYWSRT